MPRTGGCRAEHHPWRMLRAEDAAHRRKRVQEDAAHRRMPRGTPPVQEDAAHRRMPRTGGCRAQEEAHTGGYRAQEDAAHQRPARRGRAKHPVWPVGLDSPILALPDVVGHGGSAPAPCFDVAAHLGYSAPAPCFDVALLRSFHPV